MLIQSRVEPMLELNLIFFNLELDLIFEYRIFFNTSYKSHPNGTLSKDLNTFPFIRLTYILKIVVELRKEILYFKINKQRLNSTDGYISVYDSANDSLRSPKMLLPKRIVKNVERPNHTQCGLKNLASMGIPTLLKFGDRAGWYMHYSRWNGVVQTAQLNADGQFITRK